MSYMEKGQIDKTIECALVYLDKLYADMVSYRDDLWKHYGFDDDTVVIEAKVDGYGRAAEERMTYYANAVYVISNIANLVYGDDVPRPMIFRDEDGNHSLIFR